MELAKQYEEELEAKLSEQVKEVVNTDYQDVNVKNCSLKVSDKNYVEISGTAYNSYSKKTRDYMVRFSVSEEDAAWTNEVFSEDAETTKDFYEKYDSQTVKKLLDLFGDGSTTDCVWVNGSKYDYKSGHNL